MVIKNKHIAIIVSEFNKDITEKLLDGAVSHLTENHIDKNLIDIIKVPGVVEIPLTAKLLAKSKKYLAIISLGAVIRGDTDHYKYVCQQLSLGCMQTMLETEVPIIFGVLTTHDDQQALERIGGKEGHKGKDAADTALTMINIVNKIRENKF